MGNSPVQAARPDPARPRLLPHRLPLFASSRSSLREQLCSLMHILFSFLFIIRMCGFTFTSEPSSPPPPPPVEQDGLIPVENNVSMFLITTVKIVFGKSLCLLLLGSCVYRISGFPVKQHETKHRISAFRPPGCRGLMSKHTTMSRVCPAERRRHAVSHRCFFRFKALLFLNRISLHALVPLFRSTTDCISVSKAATFITTKHQQTSRIYSALLDWKPISHRLLTRYSDVWCCCRLSPVMSCSVQEMFCGSLTSIRCSGISAFNARCDYFF